MLGVTRFANGGEELQEIMEIASRVTSSTRTKSTKGEKSTKLEQKEGARLQGASALTQRACRIGYEQK